MTIHPTLVIGIGTTGIDILQEFELIWISTFKSRVPDIIKMIGFETDHGYRLEDTPLGRSDINKVNIGFSSAIAAKNLLINANNGKLPNWIEDVEKLYHKKLENVQMECNAGAMGSRPLGKLSFWSSFQQTQENMEGIKPTLVNALTNASQPNVIPLLTGNSAYTGYNFSNAQRFAFVVGSSIGGTGSGMFCDLGFLLNQLGVGHRIGLLMLPCVGGAPLNNQKWANLYATIKEIDYYMNPHRPVNPREDNNWPDGTARHIAASLPYTNIYPAGSDMGLSFRNTLISCTYKIFLDELGIYDYIQARGGGAVGRSALNTRFLRFGFAGVYHPASDLRDAAACLSAESIKNHFLREQNNVEVVGKARTFTSQAIDNRMEGMGQIGNQSERQIMENETNRLIRSEYPNYDAFKTQIVSRLFSEGEITQTCINRLDNVSQSILSDIDQDIMRELKRNFALKQANYAYKGLGVDVPTILDQLHSFWRNKEIPAYTPTDANPLTPIDTMVDKELNSLRNKIGYGAGKAALLGARKEYILETLDILIIKIKLFLISSRLNNLKTSCANKHTTITRLENNLQNNDYLMRRINNTTNNIQLRQNILFPFYISSFNGDLLELLQQRYQIAAPPALRAAPNINDVLGFLDSNIIQVRNNNNSKNELNIFIERLFNMDYNDSIVYSNLAYSMIRAFLQVNPGNLVLNVNNVIPNLTPMIQVASATIFPLNIQLGIIPANIARFMIHHDNAVMAPILNHPDIAPRALLPVTLPQCKEGLLIYVEEGNIRMNYHHDYDQAANNFNQYLHNRRNVRILPECMDIDGVIIKDIGKLLYYYLIFLINYRTDPSKKLVPLDSLSQKIIVDQENIFLKPQDQRLPLPLTVDIIRNYENHPDMKRMAALLNLDNIQVIENELNDFFLTHNVDQLKDGISEWCKFFGKSKQEQYKNELIEDLTNIVANF